MTTPKLAYDRGDDGRYYRHPLTAEEWPSVTNVTGWLAKPALQPYAAKEAALHAVNNWNELTGLPPAERMRRIKTAYAATTATAAELGSAVHDAVDRLCSGTISPPWTPDVAPFMGQFAEFLAARKPTFLRNEITVVNKSVGYAGSFDWLALIAGHVTLGDTKTGKNVWPDVALQLSALAHAEFILNDDGTEEPMPEVELTGVLHLRPRSWALVPVKCDEATWETVKALVTVQKWVVDTRPGVLGPRLQNPVAA